MHAKLMHESLQTRAYEPSKPPYGNQ